MKGDENMDIDRTEVLNELLTEKAIRILQDNPNPTEAELTVIAEAAKLAQSLCNMQTAKSAMGAIASLNK